MNPQYICVYEYTNDKCILTTTKRKLVSVYRFYLIGDDSKNMIIVEKNIFVSLFNARQ